MPTYKRKLPTDIEYEHNRECFKRVSPGEQRKQALVDREILVGLKRIEEKIDKFIEGQDAKQHGNMESAKTAAHHGT